MKRILMIAYLFPPVGGIGAAGSQRILKFAKYLPAYQWSPVVLTARPDAYESYLNADPTLLDRLPVGLRVERTGVIRWLTHLLLLKQRVCSRGATGRGPVSGIARPSGESEKVQDIGEASSPPKSLYRRAKDAITDLFEIPDEEMGWFLPAFFKGWSTARNERIDVVFSTGRPWTAHLVGLALKRVLGRPLVVDFRDPWMTNPFRLSYSHFKDAMERVLERKVVEGADLVIANTNELRDEFIHRFPGQPRQKFIALLNGFDPDDYGPEGAPQTAMTSGRFTVTHTGFLYGRRDPTPFLKAVKKLAEQEAVDRKKLRVNLVGAVELSYDLREFLVTNQLDDIVFLHNHVPFKESLAYMREATLLLLLQPGTTTQVPSKLFEYIGMKKPILAISPKEGATSRIVSREGVGVIADPDDVDSIATALETVYRQWQSRRSVDSAYEAAYRKFNVRSMTERLAALLSEVARRP